MASSTTIRYIRRRVEGHRALLAFGLSGLVGVLLDVDHFVSLVLWRYVFPQITEGRLVHTSLFIVASLIICYLVSRGRGLYHKYVLVGVAVTTVSILIWSPYVVWGWW